MRAAPGLHVEWIDDEAVVLDPETSQVHYLNPPAALVYALVLELGYPAAMEELERTRGDDPAMREDLPGLVEELVERGLLVNG